MYGQKQYPVYAFKYFECTEYILKWNRWRLQQRPTR
jgi:hypothetical protein